MRKLACGGVAALALLVTAAAAEPAAEDAAPVVPAVTTATANATAADSLGAGDPPSTLRENSYFYQSFGTPDPFRSLLVGAFEPKQQEIVDLHTVQLVGVVWEDDEVAAMVQDVQGFGYTLRPGDTVKNGTVVSITPDALVARLSIFGQTTQMTLRLQRGE
jgi:hypothetical protein